MSVKNFFRIYIGLFFAAIALVSIILTINIAGPDDIIIYHSNYFKIKDYITKKRLSFGIPLVYKGYKIRVNDISLDYPDNGTHVLKISEDTNLLFSFYMNYKIDLVNLDFIVSRYGYDFDHDLLLQTILETIDNFIYSIPKVSVLNIERFWVNERLKELLANLMHENGMVLNDFYIKDIEIERKLEKVGDPKITEKPSIVILYVPGLNRNIINTIKKEYEYVEIASIRDSYLFAESTDAEGVFITGKVAHASMLFLDKNNFDFNNYRSRFLWEILSYYTDDIAVLFPEYCGNFNSQVKILPREILNHGLSYDNEFLHHIGLDRLEETENEIEEKKLDFEREFLRAVKLRKEDMDEKISDLCDRLFFEFYLTKKAIAADNSIFIAFIRTLDDLVYNFLRYSFPRDPYVSVSEYFRYNNISNGSLAIAGKNLMDILRMANKNTLIIIISPAVYKDASKKPLSVSNNKRSYMTDNGFAVFIKNELEKDISLSSYNISLMDFFPSLLSLFDFPTARDIKGSNVFVTDRLSTVVRMISSYDSLIKGRLLIGDIDEYGKDHIIEGVPSGSIIFGSDERLYEVIRNSEDIEEFIVKLEELLQKYPFISELHSKLGFASFVGEDYQRAEEHYSRYIIKNPYTPKGFFNLGVIYAKLSFIEKAVESFLNAYSVTYNDLKIINNIAYAYLELEDYQSAGYYFRKSLDVNTEQKELLDILSKVEYLDLLDIDIYDSTVISFYEIESQSLPLMKKILDSLTRLDKSHINKDTFKAVQSTHRNFRFKEIIIKKTELNKELELNIDKTPLWTFSDVFNIGDRYISLYKYDIGLVKN